MTDFDYIIIGGGCAGLSLAYELQIHNKSEIYSGLYFVGAGTHPGAGIPGVLSSAKVLDKILQ